MGINSGITVGRIQKNITKGYTNGKSPPLLNLYSFQGRVKIHINDSSQA